MKKILVFIIVLSCFLTSYCQNYTRNGNNFSKVAKNNITSGSVTTIYTYSVNDTLKCIIHINPKSGRCFIVRTSKKTGREYPQYLPKEVCLEICKEMRVEYKE